MSAFRRRCFAVVQILFGASVALGSTGELLALYDPSLLPPEAMGPYADLHASPLVRGWVMAGNLAGLPLGLGLLAAGVGLWQGRGWAVCATRRCAALLLLLLVASQLVMALTLYPDLLAGALAIEAPVEAFWIVLLGGVAGMIWPVVALSLLRPRRSGGAVMAL